MREYMPSVAAHHGYEHGSGWADCNYTSHMNTAYVIRLRWIFLIYMLIGQKQHLQFFYFFFKVFSARYARDMEKQ